MRCIEWMKSQFKHHCLQSVSRHNVSLVASMQNLHHVLVHIKIICIYIMENQPPCNSVPPIQKSAKLPTLIESRFPSGSQEGTKLSERSARGPSNSWS